MISSTTLTTAGRLTIAATLTLFITLFANAQTVVLEPDRDNTIFSENSAKSNGAGVRLFAGRTNNGNVRRALLHFDITGNVPAGATITSVTLTMNQSKTRNGIARTIDLHKVTTDWGESTSDAPNNEGVGITAITGDATWTSNFPVSYTHLRAHETR